MYSVLNLDNTVLWFLVIGGLLTLTGVFQSVIKQLPLTTAMIYLPIGYALGSSGFGLLELDLRKNAKLVEHIAEAVVIISLFTAGLKLRSPLLSKDWRAAYRLASVSMIITIAGIAGITHFALGFSLGAAVLIGAILAPTDPVLASGVQVRGPTDRDPLRFTLTGEAGLNDGTAFPFVMLGLGLLGIHELGDYGWRWFSVDLLWAGSVGILVGTVLGTGVTRLILYLRSKDEETAILDDFLTVGLICLSYGLALCLHSYGFLAVFAAGIALRKAERVHTTTELGNQKSAEKGPESDAQPAKIAKAVLNFNEQLERLGEVLTVILVGAMLDLSFFTSRDIWILPILFLIIRPISVFIGLLGGKTPLAHKSFYGWFGVRGIGSVYYLSYAVAKGVPAHTAERLISLVLATVAVSILIHGVSVSPLMDFYQNKLSPSKRRTRQGIGFSNALFSPRTPPGTPPAELSDTNPSGCCARHQPVEH